MFIDDPSSGHGGKLSGTPGRGVLDQSLTPALDLIFRRQKERERVYRKYLIRGKPARGFAAQSCHHSHAGAAATMKRTPRNRVSSHRCSNEKHRRSVKVDSALKSARLKVPQLSVAKRRGMAHALHHYWEVVFTRKRKSQCQ